MIGRYRHNPGPDTADGETYVCIVKLTECPVPKTATCCGSGSWLEPHKMLACLARDLALHHGEASVKLEGTGACTASTPIDHERHEGHKRNVRSSTTSKVQHLG